MYALRIQVFDFSRASLIARQASVAFRPSVCDFSLM